MADEGHEFADRKVEEWRSLVAETYYQAQLDAQEALSEFLAEFSRDDADMRKKVDAGEVSEDGYEAWRREQMLRGQRYEDMLAQVTLTYAEANEYAMAMLDGALPEIYAENANFAAYQVCSSAGLGISFSLMDAHAVQEAMLQGENLLPRPSVNRAKDAAWNRRLVASQLTQGIMLGESIPKMAERVARVAASNESSAVRTARTYATAAQNAGRVSSYRKARDMGIELEQEWLATMDGRTRHSHRQVDGERVPVGGTFSNGCKFPGDPEAPYAETMNCRCTLIAAVEGIDTDDAKRWSRLPAGTTYEEWKAGNGAGSMSADNGDMGISWPPATKSISNEQFEELLREADLSGVVLSKSVKQAKVDPRAISLVIAATGKASAAYPQIRKALGRKLTVSVDLMDSNDFAMTSNAKPWLVTFNSKAMRDLEALEREYKALADSGWFVQGTTAESIAFHEVGHLLERVLKVDVRKICYNLSGAKDEQELRLFLSNSLSLYSSKKELDEVLSEVSSAWLSGVRNSFAEEFMRCVL